MKLILLMMSGIMESIAEDFKLVGPTAPLVAVAGEDLVLPCFIQPSINAVDMTVEWSRMYLRQTLVHLYEDYNDRNEDQIKSYRGRTDLFKEELQKGNTSLKLSAVQPSDEGVYKCFVQSIGWYDDVTVYIEVKGKGFHAWTIAVICISVFGVIFLAVTAYIWKVTFSKKQLSPAQCSAVAFLSRHSENVKSEWNPNKYKTSEEGLIRLIPAVSNYRKARLTDYDITKEFCKSVKSALKTEKSSLKDLDFSNSNLQDSGVEQLSAGLKSSHCKLETLRLTGCKLTLKSLEYLTSALQSENTNLKELDLNNIHVCDSGVQQLSAGLKGLHCKLEILRLTGCNLTGESCKYLTSVLQTENCSLKQLYLNNNNLQDSGVEQLSAGLKSSRCNLEILRIAGCILTTKSCEYLTSALQTENSSLKQLDLNNNNLQDSGVEQLSAGLKSSHCKLETLRLAICNLGEKTCENLASAFQVENSVLRELDLSNNDVNNSGVEQLSAGLKSSHCKLEILKLSGCLVTEEGCSSLASALSSNPSHLKELDLTYNHPGESGVKLLSARLEDPHCSLETLGAKHAGKSRIKAGLKKYACEFTLDPNTAHTLLSLSEGNRKVTCVWKEQSYPDHPERFHYWRQVLSRESVLGGESVCGRCYWEVEWSGRVGIAVTYKGISRKGDSDCRFGWNVQSWGLICSNNSYTVRYNKKETVLPAPPSTSNRVGVYVDGPAGNLSFYSVSDTHSLTHLHTFHSTFTEPLYAGFAFGSYDSSVCVCELE